jgi:hypothetical protein
MPQHIKVRGVDEARIGLLEGGMFVIVFSVRIQWRWLAVGSMTVGTRGDFDGGGV